MKKIFAAFSILIMICSTNVHSEVVNFDDLPKNYYLYGSNYAGITWGYSHLSGDIYGGFGTPPDQSYSIPKSYPNYVSNAYGVNNLSFTFDNKVSFIGAWFAKTSSSDSTTNVRLTDDLGNHSDWLTLGSNPRFLSADFTGSKTIYVERTATKDIYGGGAKTNWYSMDDVTYAPITNKSGTEISKDDRLEKWSYDVAGLTALSLPFISLGTTGLGAACGLSLPLCLAVGSAGVALAGYEMNELRKIIKDPPDPLYTKIFQPRTLSPFTLDSSSGFSQEFIDATNIRFLDQVNLASTLEAWRVSLERYSAASAAGDETNMLRQAAAIDEYILQTSQLAITAQSSFNEFLYQFQKLTGPVIFTPDQIQAAMNNLALYGFNESVLQMLSSYGLSSSEIEELRLLLLQSSIPTDSVDFYSIARSSEGGLGELAALTRCVGNSCQAVPEPTTMLLLGLGLVGLAGVRRKFKK